MKRILALATMALMTGCEFANEVKEGVKDAPDTFWSSVKEVALFIGQLLINIATGWLTSLFGN